MYVFESLGEPTRTVPLLRTSEGASPSLSSGKLAMLLHELLTGS